MFAAHHLTEKRSESCVLDFVVYAAELLWVFCVSKIPVMNEYAVVSPVIRSRP
jgi:hypothetical protein